MNLSLDDLVAMILEVMRRRFPDATHVAILVDRPGLPATVIPIRL